MRNFKVFIKMTSECSGRITTALTRSTLWGRSSSTTGATDLYHSLFCSWGNALWLLGRAILLGSTPWSLKLTLKSAIISTENRGFSAVTLFQFIFLSDELGAWNQKILTANPPGLLGITKTKQVSRQIFVRLNSKVDLFMGARIYNCDPFFAFLGV